MKKNIGILHVSDIHATKNNKEKIKRLVSLLIDDLETLKQTNNLSINAVCITGDLISSGDTAEEDLEVVLTEFIQPIIESQQLSNDKVFIVAGNHEIKKSQIVDYIENGLSSMLISEDKIYSFMKGNVQDATKRIDYFENDFVKQFSGECVNSSPFYKSYTTEVSGLKIGFVCVNSAWRSTGSGFIEKTKMIIGKETIVDGYESIKNTDIKICLFHHPLDWLVDDDKLEVEKCINSFDIILNGHIHKLNTNSYVSFNGISLFNTCGKFDNSSDVYNGYSVLSINPFNKECKVLLRKYIDHPRNCYDSAISICPNGEFYTVLGKKDDLLALSYNVVRSISKKFLDFANGFFVSNITSEKIVGDFNELFIPPVLSKFSEYEKETFYSRNDNEEKEAYTVDEICNLNKNVLLIGKKEIGKTTFLRYLEYYYLSKFNEYQLVPFLLDCQGIDYAGKNIIERACTRFVEDFCSDSDSFSKEQISSLISNGKCVIMFDNYESISDKEKNIIDEFINRNAKNKFIFAEKETIGARALRDTPLVPNCDFEKVYMCSLTKNQIRAITKTCINETCSTDNTSLVDKIVLCFKKTSLPKTPFVLSLVLSLCDNSDFAPINEVSVLERFMETILEKNSPNEIYSKTFDFKDKEDFLIFLVSKMNEKNAYYFSNDEFKKILDEYHDKIGFSIDETGFDRIFFNNGVLIRTRNVVTFRYSCMVEYYLAKKAACEPEFLNAILTNKNYLNYEKEILYYAGMHRKDSCLINLLRNELYSYMDVLKEKPSQISDYDIGIDIDIPEEVFSQKIEETRLTQVESDTLRDAPDSSEKTLPETIDKNVDYNDVEAFINTLLLYGGCIKNLELLDFSVKTTAYNDFLLGLRILLSILKELTEEFMKDTLLEAANETSNGNKNIQLYINDILKIALPLSVQSIALDAIGTTKLKRVFENMYQNNSIDDFDLFFCVFTMCDLRLPGIKTMINEYIQKTKNTSLLKIIFFKLFYYYQFRYFGVTMDAFLLDKLAEINLKMKHKSKMLKSQYVEQIKNFVKKKEG